MNRQDIIAMARENEIDIELGDQHVWCSAAQLFNTVNLAIAKDREECAKLCDAEADGRGSEDAFMAKLCAKAIRARGAQQ